MYVFELVKPGMSINLDEGELAWKFHWLLDQLESAFYDANVSLNLFELERAKVSNLDRFSREQWDKDSQKSKS